MSGILENIPIMNEEPIGGKFMTAF